MTQQVMIGLNVAYKAKRGGGTIAGFHELHLLDTGAIAILDENNNIIETTTTAADLIKVQKFVIAQGGSSEALTPKLSIPIDRNAMTQWYNTYEAPVLHKIRVGKVASTGTLGLPGTLLNGTIATLVVTNRTNSDVRPNQIKRYTVSVYSTDTATTILTRLAAVVNADADRIVNATILNDATNDYIDLTAITVGTTFKVGVDDVLVNATVASGGTSGTANGFTGYGTNAKVKATLKEDALTRGDAFRMQGRDENWYSYLDVLEGDSSSTFHGWTFQWKEEAIRNTRVVQTTNPVVVLFIKVAAAGLANINTILNNLLLAPSTEAGGSSSGISSGEGVTVDDIPAGGQG